MNKLNAKALLKEQVINIVNEIERIIENLLTVIYKNSMTLK